MHRVALDNIRHAFPDMPAAEHAGASLREAWDNLGRTACEYVHMDRIWDFDPARPDAGRIQIAPEVIERFERLRDDGKPALFFAAHLANWELPAIAAARHGLPSRGALPDAEQPASSRATSWRCAPGSMGELIPAGIAAPIRMMEALDRGLHVGMLVDQRFGRGPRVAFLGRPAASNPLLARLARRFDCPVHGARAIRLPGGRLPAGAHGGGRAAARRCGAAWTSRRRRRW